MPSSSWTIHTSCPLCVHTISFCEITHRAVALHLYCMPQTSSCSSCSRCMVALQIQYRIRKTPEGISKTAYPKPHPYSEGEKPGPMQESFLRVRCSATSSILPAAANHSSSGIKEIPQSLIDECGIGCAGAPSSKVTPDTGYHPQLCIGHVADLILLIGHREVQVYQCWHDDCLCLHASQWLSISWNRPFRHCFRALTSAHLEMR